MRGTRGVLSSICLCLACILSLGQQRRGSPLLADPARELVRVRIFITTTAPRLELKTDGGTLANAVFAFGSAGSTVRALYDRGAIAVSGNPPGSELHLQIDAILADVREGASVGWNVVADGRTRIEILNRNDTPLPIETFDLAGGAHRVETSGDLLRRSGPLPAPRPIGSRLVLAFFYPWWNLNTWDGPDFIDRPLRPYSTESTTDLARVMSQANEAGVDALVVSWSGKAFDGGIDNRRILNCLAAAQTAGIQIATLFETTVANPQHIDGNADPGTVFRWLVDVVDTYASHPAYLRVGGRAVVLAYAAQRLSQDGWREALRRLRDSGRDVLLIGEGINSTRLGALDGLFFYPSNAFQGDEIRTFDLAQSLSVRTYHLLPGDSIGRRVWVATASPGYDDTHLNDGRVARVSEREGGQYYERQWQSAMDMRADWVVITSWNEWFENTHIEPSVRYGDLYTRLTKEWADRFRRSRAIPR